MCLSWGSGWRPVGQVGRSRGTAGSVRLPLLGACGRHRRRCIHVWISQDAHRLPRRRRRFDWPGRSSKMTLKFLAMSLGPWARRPAYPASAVLVVAMPPLARGSPGAPSLKRREPGRRAAVGLSLYLMAQPSTAPALSVSRFVGPSHSFYPRFAAVSGALMLGVLCLGVLRTFPMDRRGANDPLSPSWPATFRLATRSGLSHVRKSSRFRFRTGRAGRRLNTAPCQQVRTTYAPRPQYARSVSQRIENAGRKLPLPASRPEV